MKKIYSLMFWCLLLGTLVSCEQAEDSSNPDPAPVEEKDYLPTTTGSTWAYEGLINYNVTATGKTKVIGGKTFQELETKQGSTVNLGYISKENGVYTAIGIVSGLGNLQLAMLKEDLEVGKTWEQTTVVNSVNTHLLFTMEEKGITHQVEGKTFKDVIKVNLETTYSLMGMDFDQTLSADYYFAKGVGLIESDFGAMGKVSLVSYNVK